MDAALERFRQRVLDDAELQHRLLAEGDPVRFAVRVVALAHVEGIEVDIDAVRGALDAARDDGRFRWL